MKRKRTTRNSLKSSFSQQPLSETKLIATEAAIHLPDECWESICTFLMDNNDDNYRYLKPLSLTSKQLFSITNRLRSSLTICSPMLLYVQTLCHRFPNLTSIHITNIPGDLNDLLCQISNFPFNLKSLKLSNILKFPTKGLRVLSKKITTLTSFSCSNIISLNNKHCVLISSCFPLLEEFHLHNKKYINFNRFGDGLKAMLLALPKLRKIDLFPYYNFYLNTNEFLLKLCKNCEFLEDIGMLDCRFLTNDGIASAIRERPSLRSLSVTLRSNRTPNNISSSHVIDSLVCLKGLTCLDLSHSQLSDELLSSIAMGDLPLRRLVLHRCTGYSYVGIFSLLSKYQLLQHLDLRKTNFLNDQHVVQLSSFIGNLVSVNLSECMMLTKLALFELIRKCPLLSEIKMESIGKESVENSDSLMDFGVYPQLTSLHLADNPWLSDEIINTFASIFPNLQLLDLNYCTDISEEGIGQVLRRCCKIRHLNLSKLKPLRINFKVLTLEVLNLSNSGIDDSSLYMISKYCFGLLQLELRYCSNITEKGVIHVVENCTYLRDINLYGCCKVAADVVDSMVFTRPSLRKITTPLNFRFCESRVKQFLSHGCLVQNSSYV